jgi:hypothetical protein
MRERSKEGEGRENRWVSHRLGRTGAVGRQATARRRQAAVEFDFRFFFFKMSFGWILFKCSDFNIVHEQWVSGNRKQVWVVLEMKSVGLFFRQRNRMGLRIFGVLFCVDFSSNRMGNVILRLFGSMKITLGSHLFILVSNCVKILGLCCKKISGL